MWRLARDISKKNNQIGRCVRNVTGSSVRINNASVTSIDYFTNTSTTKLAGVSASDGMRKFSSMVAQRFEEEPYESAIAKGYDAFEAMLTCGGDDRSLILESSTNKYHIRPQPVDPDHVFRGSCTGNPPTQRGYDAAKKLYETLNSIEEGSLDSAIADVFADQRNRISNVLQLEEGTEVIIVPSGSDAEYLPLAIVRSLKGNVPISNGITQLREIGAGSAPAAVGEYFSTHAPLKGKLSDDVKYLSGFEGLDGINIPAREQNGDAIDASKKMDEFVTTSLAAGSYPIVHGVFGGKTGIRDERMPGSMDGGETSLGVVDACQGRFSLNELHGWLKQDSIVLYTSSKFYQAPPFCGAVIIPPKIAAKIRNSPGPKEMMSLDGLGGFLTDKELPDCLENWKPLLQKENCANVGLALRWEAGLAGMEALENIPDERRTEAYEEWADAVATMVKKEAVLDPWCVERSIVSIRVSKQADDGQSWLSMSELRDLYRWMSMDISNLVPGATDEEKNALSKPAYIGQPVDVAESHAIVRIALGVESMLSYFENKDETLQEDQITVLKLAAIGKHFNTLKQSGI